MVSIDVSVCPKCGQVEALSLTWSSHSGHFMSITVELLSQNLQQLLWKPNKMEVLVCTEKSLR